MFFQVCFSFILSLHLRYAEVDAFPKYNDLDEARMKRAIGDQAPQGKCLSFKLARQNDKQTIEYVCCNNCGETNQNCLGTTYVSGSTGDYCDSCGENKLNFSQKVTEPFSCGGCDGQTRKKDTCQAQYSTIPSACWLFRGCFKHECEKEQGYSVNGTCFNGVCDSGENVYNCPADCCFRKNPQNCTLVNGKCPLNCCSRSSCCEKQDEKQDDAKGTSGGLTFVGWLKYIGMLIGFIVLCAIFYQAKKILGCGDIDCTCNEVHPTDSD